MKWTQELYAFILRRLLDPYLTKESKEKLVQSIDLSIQDGRFVLHDLDIEPSFLTKLVRGRGINVSFTKVYIRKITFHLSVQSEKSYDFFDTSEREEASASFTVSTMKKILLLRHEKKSLSLFASVHIEGFEVCCFLFKSDDDVRFESEIGEELDIGEDREIRHDQDCEKGGYLSSLIDSAIASLRLKLSLSEFHFKASSNVGGSDEVLLCLYLKSACYHDCTKTEHAENEYDNDDRSVNTESEMNVNIEGPKSQARSDLMELERLKSDDFNVLFHKVIEFSNLVFKVSGKGFSSKLDDVVAEYKGCGHLNFNAYVKADKNSNKGLFDLSNEIELSLPHEFMVNLDEKKIQDIMKFLKYLSFSIEDKKKSCSKSRYEQKESVEHEKRLKNDENNSDVGKMRHNVEARILAQTREFRGGMLVPSNFDEEGKCNDDVTFDAFFDCNETSFSQYLNVINSTTVDNNIDSERENAQLKFSCMFEHGTIHIAVGEGSMQQLPFYDQFIIISFRTLNAAVSQLHSRSSASLDVRHFHIGCSTGQSTSTESKLGHQRDIKDLLRFPFDDSLKNLYMITYPPKLSLCMNYSENKVNVLLDVQPFDLIFIPATFERCKLLIDSCVDQSEDWMTNDNDEGRGEGILSSFTFTCAQARFFAPIDTNKIDSNELNSLFHRNGHCSSIIVSKPMIGICFSTIHSQQNEIQNLTLATENITLFVCAPYDFCEVESPTLLEIVSCSGDLQSSNDSLVKFQFTKNSFGDKSSGTAHKKKSFPLVTPLSSVKARQVNPTDTCIFGDPEQIMLSEAEKCDTTFEIYLPIVMIDSNITEWQVLLKIISSVERIEQKKKSTTEEQNKKTNFLFGINLICDQASIGMQQSQFEKDAKDLFTHFLILENVKAHFVVDPTLMRSMRCLAHKILMYEATTFQTGSCVLTDDFYSSDSLKNAKLLRSKLLSSIHDAIPIFYRSTLACPLSQETPALVIDMINYSDDDGEGDSSLHISVYDMTYRYDFESKWFYRFNDMLKEMFKPVTKEIDTLKDDAEEDESIIKTFVTFSDCVIDYSTPKESFERASRLLIRLGELRFSSNYISGTTSTQAYKSSISDLTVSICNWRFPYNIENTMLSCCSHIMKDEDKDTSKCPLTSTLIKRASIEEVLDEMGFVPAINLDSMDIFVKVTNDFRRNSSALTDNKAQTTVNLTMGLLSMRTCKDSFACLTESLHEWSLNFNAISLDEVEAMRAPSIPLSTTEKNGRQLHPSAQMDFGTENILNMVDEDVFAQNNDITPKFVDDSTLKDDEEKFRLTEVPDYELSATDLRRKHGVVAMDDVETKLVAKSLLIKNFYTIDSTGIIPKSLDHSQTCKDNFRDDAKRKEFLVTDEHVDDSIPLGGYDWTTVDYSWSRNMDEKAIWFHDETESREIDQDIPKLKVFPHHVQPVMQREDPTLFEGDAFKIKGNLERPSAFFRILLSNLSVEFLFFDGWDWNKSIEYSMKTKQNFSREMFDDVKTSSFHKKTKIFEELLGEDELHVQDSWFHEVDVIESKKKGRDDNKCFQFICDGVKLRFDSFTTSKEHNLTSSMKLKIANLSLIESISSSRPKIMMSEWINESDHPRDSNDGILMLHVVSMRPPCKFSVDGKLMSDESLAKLDMLPLRCYIDQVSLQFIKHFFASDEDIVERTFDSSSTEKQDKEDILVGTFFKCFSVTSTKLKVDYTPTNVDLVSLKGGNYSELLNFLPVEKMELELQPIQIKNVVGWGSCLSETVSRWIEDIASTQIHKFITGATPFHTISNISGGMADLVLIPAHEFKQGGPKRVRRAVKKSASNFILIVASEALHNTSKVTEKIAKVLNEVAPMSAGTTMPPVLSMPPRPAQKPKGIGDTMEHAFESVSRGVRAANYTIMVVPRKEYEKNGASNAVSSALKAVPIAVLAPLSGVSEAISYSLLGARNNLRPDVFNEDQSAFVGKSEHG